MCLDLGRDVPDSEKLYARKLWADFALPIIRAEKKPEKIAAYIFLGGL